MALLPAHGVIEDLDPAHTQADLAGELGAMRDFIAQILGGDARTELTISGGAVTPPDGAGGGVFTIDTEGNAASDDLVDMTTTNMQEGQIVILYAENASRVVTIKHGTGNYSLLDSADFVFASLSSWVAFQLRATTMVELARFVMPEDLTELTTLATDDLFTVWDTSAGTWRSVPQSVAVKPPTVEFLTSGTAATYTSLTGAKKQIIEGWGAGGGAGGVDGGTSETAASTAGAGGGCFRKEISSPQTSYTYTIGQGGAGGSAGNNNGSAGGNTTLTGTALSLAANGGGAGTGMASTATSSVASGPAGGSASGGDVNWQGSDASSRHVLSGLAASLSISGAAPMIGGGVRTNISSNGTDGRVPGEGGGACASTTATNYAGGEGADGLIKITTYY